MPREPSIACVIVHHWNLDGLRTAVDLLAAEGIGRADIVVVDNSGPEMFDGDLARAAGDGVAVERVPNLGYGHAASHRAPWRLMIELRVRRMRRMSSEADQPIM